MPSLSSVLEPKLSALQARIEVVKTKVQASGAFDGLAGELAGIAADAHFLQEFGGRLITMIRLGSE